MSIIYRFLSPKKNKESGKQELMLRYSNGRNIQLYAKTHIFILEKFFNPDIKDMVVKARLQTKDVVEALEKKAMLDSLCLHINNISIETSKEDQTSDWLQNLVDNFIFPNSKQDNMVNSQDLNPQEIQPKQSDFFNTYATFLTSKDISKARYRHYIVLSGLLHRFELYNNITLNLESITSQTLIDFEQFMRIEHTLFRQNKNDRLVPKAIFAHIYEKYPIDVVNSRGDNYISEVMKMFRAFFIWANNQDLTANNPFRKYKIITQVYGTPIYISNQERDQIYQTDLSDQPRLQLQRDVFIFQCYVGCRVSDLLKFTKDSLTTDKYGTFISYIPQKTKDENPTTVKVYLSPVALEIIDRYKIPLMNTNKILPTVNASQYNLDIKDVFRACGITRIVPQRNSVTGNIDQVCIADIASSHMARRTFVGNLYKKVKDPNLVGKLSGHKDGSKAFARYRDIDDELISSLTDLI